MIKPNETQENYAFSDDNWIALNLVKEGSKVLSCGCGNGREVSFLVQEKHCKVTAIDIQAEYIAHSMEREPNVNYICGDIVEYKKENTYDYVVCLWNTINYLTKPERIQFINNCYNNLKPNGYLIIVSADKSKRWRYALHNIRYHIEYYYSPSEIDIWFENKGLTYKVNNLNNTNLIIAQKNNQQVKGGRK